MRHLRGLLFGLILAVPASADITFVDLIVDGVSFTGTPFTFSAGQSVSVTLAADTINAAPTPLFWNATEFVVQTTGGTVVSSFCSADPTPDVTPTAGASQFASVTQSVTVPTAPGSYDIFVIAHESDTCDTALGNFKGQGVPFSIPAPAPPVSHTVPALPALGVIGLAVALAGLASVSLTRRQGQGRSRR